MLEDEVVSLGDRIAAECGDEVIGVEVTVSRPGRRVPMRRPTSDDSLDRGIEQVVVRASIHSGRTTSPLPDHGGEEMFVVGEAYTFGGRRIRSRISNSVTARLRKEGWKTVARRIKRIYGYLERSYYQRR
jgi:uncharacterized Zn finger protein